MRFRPTRLRGFSLVEILVVIVIVAVLAGMLLPAVMLVRDSARSVTCASNLRQAGLAIQTYSSDWNGCLPPSCDDNGITRWFFLVQSYLDDTDRSNNGTRWAKIILCPAADLPFDPSCPNQDRTHYCANSMTMPDIGSWDWYGGYGCGFPVPLSQVNRKSEIFLLTDGAQQINGATGATMSAWNNPGLWDSDPTHADLPITPDPNPEPATWPGSTVYYRHHGKATFLFVDGHVGSIAKGGLLRRNSNWKWY